MRRGAAFCCALLCVALAGGQASASELAAKIERLRALVGPRTTPRPAARPTRVCERPDAVLPADRRRIEAAVRDASIRFAVAPGLIRAVIQIESAGNPGALSHAGAMGLMQLMPATAASLGVVCAFEPRQNVLGGTRYLRALRDELGSWRRALSAYNAGPTRVASGRIPNETRRYVDLVMDHWQREGSY